ncbi:unnamed protein product [Ostreobium quekettii]|uniref:GPI transamidase subunit PIG-U n=1 Tax=Ostreobium quekettii TaxID=121088 RepID=A0A8S1ISW1_9CHLO|nr:unnamed protein product [Ostreobium quekettii]|eukprot:evm.model.scf_191.13 EVM.evm.TU.scf_191.13   scf_191:94913-99626(-)
MAGILDRRIWCGVALRTLLAGLGAAPRLVGRVEIASPLSSLVRVREGLALGDQGLSPYTGDAYHGPPLALSVFSGVARHPLWSLAPLIAADVASAALLSRLAQLWGLSPGWKSAGVLYLLNPLTVLACVGGSLGSIENLLVYVSIYGGATSNIPLCAFGLAAAAYWGLHPLLLMLPLCQLMYIGVEPATVICIHGLTGGSAHQPAEGLSRFSPVPTARGREKPPRKGWPGLLLFLCYVAFWIAFLCVLSEVALRKFKEHSCRSWVLGIRGSAECAEHADDWRYRSAAKHWMAETYGFMLRVEDLTPNIGLFWYFFTEMFDNFRSFFIFVFHSLSVLFLVPMMVRMPEQPLVIAVLQCIINALFKPYPTISDIALYMGLLPLFPVLMRHFQWWFFMCNSFLLLAVLGPAMWHQWIQVGSANSNFFYSITLLLAIWQVVLLVMLVDAALSKGQNLEKESQKTKAE